MTAVTSPNMMEKMVPQCRGRQLTLHLLKDPKLKLHLALDKKYLYFEMNLGMQLLVGCSSRCSDRFSNICFLKNLWCSWTAGSAFFYSNLLLSLLKSGMQHHPLPWLNVLKFRGKDAHLLLSHLMRQAIRRSSHVGIIEGPRLVGAPGISLSDRWIHPCISLGFHTWKIFTLAMSLEEHKNEM